MHDTIDPVERTAKGPADGHEGSVTLINSFVVSPERDEAFFALWQQASHYFRMQPGFVSLRFHRAVSPDAQYRYVNVATWATMTDFHAAHGTAEWQELVRQEAWKEFPNNPALYEVVASADANADALQPAT